MEITGCFEMKKIHLGNGFFSLIDDSDYERVSRFKWHVLSFKGKNRAIRGRYNPVGTIYLSRFIIGLDDSDKRDIDHINGNSLDDRRSNLRVCSRSQNMMNKAKTKNNKTSKYKGVYWASDRKMWRSEIRLNYKAHRIGQFNDEIEAAIAYDRKALELFGEFAKTNFKTPEFPYSKLVALK